MTILTPHVNLVLIFLVEIKKQIKERLCFFLFTQKAFDIYRM